MQYSDYEESGPMENPGIGDCESMEPISSGATSITYKAFRNNRYVLLKVLRPEFANDPFYRDAFRKEYEIGRKLDSPYLPHYDQQPDNTGTPTLQTEYIQGQTLQEIMEQNPTYLRNRRNLQMLVEQLLTGLSHLHAQRVVHLDVKPGNLIIDRVNGHLHIIDLGFCYTDAMPFTMGMTNAFAAPEQLEGRQVDARTDLYAVGKLLTHIQEATHQKLTRKLKRMAQRCLQSRPEDRYRTAQEALDALRDKGRRRLLLALPLLAIGITATTLLLTSRGNGPGAQEHYDFVDINVLNTEPVYYRILSEDSAWVELTYKRITGNDYDDDMSIPQTVVFGEKEYTVVAIGDSAFNHCKQLRGVSLPASIRQIGDRAFNDCPQLTTVTLPDGVEHIGTFAFGSCKSLTRIHIPESLTTIAEGCFFDTQLQEITIPEGVTSIRRDAFCGCNALQKVRLPESLEILDRGIFYHCESLQSIILPAHLKSIGEYCFDECPNLTDVHCLGVLPPKATTIFLNTFPGPIYVPQGSAPAYRQAECWDQYDIVEE